jgi:hypothetical protein
MRVETYAHLRVDCPLLPILTGILVCLYMSVTLSDMFYLAVLVLLHVAEEREERHDKVGSHTFATLHCEDA